MGSGRIFPGSGPKAAVTPARMTWTPGVSPLPKMLVAPASPASDSGAVDSVRTKTLSTKKSTRVMPVVEPSSRVTKIGQSGRMLVTPSAFAGLDPVADWE